MIRWKYVVPRVLIVLAVSVLLCFSLGPLLHLAIKYGGQAVTGARVELADVTVDLRHSQLILKGLRVADPTHDQQNLIEADDVFFDLETDAALRRKLVVREGRVSGLRLQAGRSESGALENSDGEPGFSVVDQVKERGEAWLDSSVGALQQNLKNELHTVQLSRELRQRWPVEYERLSLRGKQIETEGQKLKDDVELIAERPLENLHLVQPTLERIDHLRREVTETRQQLDALQQQVQLDKDAIAEAKEHDVAYVREKLHADALDAESLNDYLLGPAWSKRLVQALQWIQMTRELTGEGAPPQATSSRGLSVLFPGYHATPDLLIRKLLLDGSGTAGGNSFDFVGQIDDLTPQARRHSQPTTVQITANGAIDLIGKATLDRRHQIPEDHFVVDIPAIQQTGQTLGDRQQFAVEIAPGIATIRADIRVIDQELQGWIKMNQRDLNLTPHLGPKYSKYLTGDRLQGVRDIDEFAAEISISGPLQQPRWKLQSDLGARLASSLNAAVQEEIAERQRQLIEQGNQIVDRELGDLQENLMKDHRQLLETLEIGDEQLDLIKRQLMAEAGSPDQILGQGKKLLEMFK